MSTIDLWLVMGGLAVLSALLGLFVYGSFDDRRLPPRRRRITQ